MPVVNNQGAVVEERFAAVADDTAWPETGGLLVGLELWQNRREDLLASGRPLGLRLRSDEHPDAILPDLPHFDLVALEFPVFRDGRAYSRRA